MINCHTYLKSACSPGSLNTKIGGPLLFDFLNLIKRISYEQAVLENFTDTPYPTISILKFIKLFGINLKHSKSNPDLCISN